MMLCVLFTLAVAGIWIWMGTQPARDEAAARDDMRVSVDALRDGLEDAAADGILQDEGIVQLFPPEKPAGPVDIKRRGDVTTIIAGVLGHGPPRTFIFVYEATVSGCYAFDVTPRTRGTVRVSTRELPGKTCASATSNPNTPIR
ncbi:hypothetical protein [Streptomyces sp. NPDC001970]